MLLAVLPASFALPLDAAADSHGFIDGHAHILGKSGPNGGVDRSFETVAGGAFWVMDKAGVSLSVVMAPPFTAAQDGLFDVGELKEGVAGLGGRFVYLGGGGTLNVMIHEAVREGEVSADVRGAFENKAKAILASGAAGFGELAALHVSRRPKHPFMEAPPDHPLFLLLSDIAAASGVPIDLHMEAVVEDMPTPEKLNHAPNPATLSANIDAFEKLLAHNPKTQIIWAHAGWDNTGHRTVDLMRRLLAAHPNLFMSIKISRGSLSPETVPLDKRRKLRPEWLLLLSDFPDRFILGSDAKYRTGEGDRFKSGVKLLLDQLPIYLARRVGSDNPRALFSLAE